MVLLNMDTENVGYAGGATEAAADGVNRDGKDVSAECAARAELKGTLAAAAKSAEREGLSIGKEFRSAEGGVLSAGRAILSTAGDGERAGGSSFERTKPSVFLKTAKYPLRRRETAYPSSQSNW